jgi:uncharacterized protein YmfQ (DUF2313 family)
MTDKVKLEGLKTIDMKKPVEKIKEIIYTSPVKIGDKEYIIKPLSMLDVKKMNIERKSLKKDDATASFDFTFKVMLNVIKKWNPDTKDLTVNDFEEMIGLDEFERIQAAILQITKLKKYFTMGASGK